MLRLRNSFAAFVLAIAVLRPAPPAHAYVDLAPTLSRIIADSQKIALVEVKEFNREKATVLFREVRALKGEASAAPVVHAVVTAEGAAIPRHIRQWAAPGARGVLFTTRDLGLVCIGQGWYQVKVLTNTGARLAKERPDLPLAYYGPVSRLAEGVEAILAGKDAVLTVVAHGADDEGASFDLALNRFSLPDLVRVQRIRANMRMPGMVMAASANPAYMLGPGAVAEEDLPALTAKLDSPDATIRAAAADDLRCLVRKAAPAAPRLTKLLHDPVAAVRLSAASALLQIDPTAAGAVDVLAKGLNDSNAVQRCDAVRATGTAGPAAAPLCEKLAGLLKDGDEPLQISALQAIAMLGPAAAKAADAVVPLLDKPEWVIDAADALGRIGPAARPALKRLTKLLESEQPAVRWAAVRAMSQIGGEEARPAVDFMVQALPKATEIDGYNMMIYLALLGPVAKDAVPTIRSTRIKNPVLPSATVWAIESDKSFPWSGGGRFGMPGPGGPGGDGQGPNFAVLIYEAYVHELGPRLEPAARVLARRILEGTAGNVPAWGYKILAAAPDAAVETLAPRLADGDLVMRERAAVALGYMGAAAAPVAKQVQAALDKAPTQREKRLLAWCLREIGRPE